MKAYEDYISHKLSPYAYPEERIRENIRKLLEEKKIIL